MKSLSGSRTFSLETRCWLGPETRQEERPGSVQFVGCLAVSIYQHLFAKDMEHINE